MYLYRNSAAKQKKAALYSKHGSTITNIPQNTFMTSAARTDRPVDGLAANVFPRDAYPPFVAMFVAKPAAVCTSDL